MERVDTVIVGAGQAGLATSYWLTQHGHEHVVLERAATPASVWRNKRWDSFTMVTPNWTLKMPGLTANGIDPDGFMPQAEIVDFFARYVSDHKLPVRLNTTVTAIERHGDHRYRIHSDDGTTEAANVVAATGFFQQPKIPVSASALAPGIIQLHTDGYRNPESLPAGAVLIVGSGMSGCQIAEELYLGGRTVYLATGSTGRAPRRYRGKDIIWWLDAVGFLDLPIDQMPPGSTRFDSIPHVSGANGGHTLNLHQFARDGVTLLGRLQSIDGSMATFAPNLPENLARADGFEQMVVEMIDGHVQRHGLEMPTEELPRLRDGYDQPVVEHLDLRQAGISTVIWATGYGVDYHLVRLPVCDGDGLPIQDRGVTRYPGLHFAGMPWMPGHRSGMLLGVGESTRHVAASIAGMLATR